MNEQNINKNKGGIEMKKLYVDSKFVRAHINSELVTNTSNNIRQMERLSDDYVAVEYGGTGELINDANVRRIKELETEIETIRDKEMQNVETIKKELIKMIDYSHREMLHDSTSEGRGFWEGKQSAYCETLESIKTGKWSFISRL